MNTVHRASFLITPHVLQKMLQMPEGVSIAGVIWEFSHDAVRIYVDGKMFPPSDIGVVVPQIEVTINETRTSCGGRRIEWNWTGAPARLPGPFKRLRLWLRDLYNRR